MIFFTSICVNIYHTDMRVSNNFSHVCRGSLSDDALRQSGRRFALHGGKDQVRKEAYPPPPSGRKAKSRPVIYQEEEEGRGRP